MYQLDHKWPNSNGKLSKTKENVRIHQKTKVFLGSLCFVGYKQYSSRMLSKSVHAMEKSVQQCHCCVHFWQYILLKIIQQIYLYMKITNQKGLFECKCNFVGFPVYINPHTFSNAFQAKKIVNLITQCDSLRMVGEMIVLGSCGSLESSDERS